MARDRFSVKPELNQRRISNYPVVLVPGIMQTIVHNSREFIMNNPEVESENLEISSDIPEPVQNDSGLDSFSDEDLITIEEAISLSGISKSLFYQRKGALGIGSIKQGRTAYVHIFEVKAIRDYSTGLATVSAGGIEQNQQRSQQPVTISPADIQQIKVDAAQRVKAKRLATIKVSRAMEENPDLLPADIRAEIEAEELAMISTPIAQRNYYDPELLASLALELV